MKIVGKIEPYQDGSFTVETNNYVFKNLVNTLEPKEYSIEIKEIKSKRSIEQNKYLWLLIHEIDEAINGESRDEMEVYTMLLEMANAKFDYIGCLAEAEDMLRKNFRAIKFIKKIDLNGVEGNMYKVFLGSSKMNTKEMSQLIDTTLDFASQLGIETEYYKELLK